MRTFIPCLIFGLLPSAAIAQTTHPLLVQMQEKARSVEYGSYRIVAKEHYPYSSDTILYRANCAFSRFEHFDGKPGIRYDVEMETQQPNQTIQQRMVFDGFIKYDLRSDTLLMLYDSRELGDDYVLRGLQHFLFVPLLLHPYQVQHFLGPDKMLGTPPYGTLGDTVIGNTPCRWVGADWASDSAGIVLQHIRFGLSVATGLPVYFSHEEETVQEMKNKSNRKRSLEIRVEEWSPALPMNVFYIDWQSLPASFEVRHFHDCYNRELLRSRSMPGL